MNDFFGFIGCTALVVVGMGYLATNRATVTNTVNDYTDKAVATATVYKAKLDTPAARRNVDTTFSKMRGQHCEANYECEGTLMCGPVSRTCFQPVVVTYSGKKAGQRCKANLECEGDLVCDIDVHVCYNPYL